MYDKTIHPDPVIAAEAEIERLEGLLCEARAGLRRGLEFNAATPHGLSVKHDLRSALERSDPAVPA